MAGRKREEWVEVVVEASGEAGSRTGQSASGSSVVGRRRRMEVDILTLQTLGEFSVEKVTRWWRQYDAGHVERREEWSRQRRGKRGLKWPRPVQGASGAVTASRRRGGGEGTSHRRYQCTYSPMVLTKIVEGILGAEVSLFVFTVGCPVLTHSLFFFS